MTGVERIAKERQRQIEAKGYDAGHDDAHVCGELAMAAVCYAATDQVYVKDEYENGVDFSDPWPWAAQFDKRPRSDADRGIRIRQLEKAGALIAAEIDRLLRK